ncbi:alkaline phosphatase D family protein [Candidatus Neomarinimicrobiota bacterium]
MNRLIRLYPILFLLICFNCTHKEPTVLGTETMGEFAPKEAYLKGEIHPYYGSENAWDQRFFYEQDKEYYKRRGQRAMLELTKGNIDGTIKYCQDLLKNDPNDLEAMFNLSAALAQQNKIDEAIHIVRESVDKGLPLERYLVGPKEILKPLVNSIEFQKILSHKEVNLIHGPMLGKVTDHSASFWVRTAEENDVQIYAGTSSSMSKHLYSKIVKTQAEKDYTAVIDIDGLEADSYYFYDVLINGEPAQKEIHMFKTFPKKGSPAKFSIIFGGGAGYVPENERIFKTILKQRPIASLWMGDNVYINMPQDPNAVHYYTYYRKQSRSEFRKLVSSTSNYAIWDDHDAATDDCWLGPYKDKPSWKMPLLEIFKENWINPYNGTEEWPGTYFNFVIGDVEIFMLDGRIYRTNPWADNPTMLGPAQKEWLLNSLKNSTAIFKVIASPVPWSFESKKGAKDTWNGFHDERDEIFDFLSDNKIDGVFLISADRHRSDAWKIERDQDYPLYEFMSSRLTNQHTHPLEPGALFGYNEKPSFGKLTFDTKTLYPSVTYDIYNIDNEKIQSLILTKSMLLHKE